MSEKSFSSLEESSKRWISEGKQYKDALNDWLDIIYLENKEPDDPEPVESRKDMAQYVIEQVKFFNENNDHDTLRKLFPPDYDPLADEYQNEFTHCVSKALLLDNSTIITKIGQFHDEEQTVFKIDDNTIERIDEVITFGSSYNKKYIAKALKDKITISEGWDGDIITELKYPESYGEDFTTSHPHIKINKEIFKPENLAIESINVFKNGKKVLLCSHGGIFVLEEDTYQLLHPGKVELEEIVSRYEEDDYDEDFNVFLDYPNADLSPDDLFIALGSQDSYHIIMTEENEQWKESGWIEPRSSYPHCVKFNYLIKDENNEPYNQVALSSCHFSESATIALPLNNFTDGFEASGYSADESLDYIDETNWVYSILPSPAGYLLGSNNGYIWFKFYQGIYQFGYMYIGGTVMDIDISDDRNTLIVASYSGQIIKLQYEIKDGEYKEKGNNRKDPFMITNMGYVDKKRYIFWKGCDPMIW